jgi:hypothetical protein
MSPGVPRSRRRAHHMDLPHMRSDGVRSATHHRESGAQPALDRLSANRDHPLDHIILITGNEPDERKRVLQPP